MLKPKIINKIEVSNKSKISVKKIRYFSYTRPLGKIMKQLLFILVILIIFSSCQTKKEEDKTEENVAKKSIVEVEQKDNFQTYFKIDSTLVKRDTTNFLTISNKEKFEKFIPICNCEKNIKQNTIKIQLTTAIPTKEELRNGEKGSRLFMDLGNPGTFKGQIKTLTFHLRDSLVEKIDFISKSTDKDYGGKGYEYMKVEKYQIDISTMDYSIASNIFGNYNIILPKEYGYFQNDTILSGEFECNNWRINKLEDLKALDLNEWNEKKKQARFGVE